MCANIEPMDTAVKRAMATFPIGAIGFIYLQQPQTDLEIADTQVFVQFNYADGTPPTSDHKWHIHKERIHFNMVESDWCPSVQGIIAIHCIVFRVREYNTGSFMSDVHHILVKLLV